MYFLCTWWVLFFLLRYHGLPSQLFKAAPYPVPCTVSISQATRLSDLMHLAFPMLRYLGCHVACDAALVTKIIRLIKAFISMVGSEHALYYATVSLELFAAFKQSYVAIWFRCKGKLLQKLSLL